MLGVCEECIKELLKRDVDIRKKVWKRLPELLGLDIKEWGASKDDESGENEG